MRLWVLVLIVLIANVFAGPVLWIGVAVWGVVALYSKYKQATKKYKP